VLTPLRPDAAAMNARTLRREKRLWDKPTLTLSLGCVSCRQYDICGGLRTEAALLDCIGLCCGRPANCTTVCRNKPADFVARVREIGGFDLNETPRTPELVAPPLPGMVPVIYHGSKRTLPYPGSIVALPLYALLRKRSATVKFSSREALCRTFRIAIDSTVIVTGTAKDPPLERWWSYGEARGRDIIAALLSLGVRMATTPNYSLFANVPRWDDMHSMKRIALTFAQFANAGMPVALHVNGRTERDFERWDGFLRARPEVTHLAYEFATGAGHGDRYRQHLAWLSSLAASVGRPLHLLVRGGHDVLPELSQAFASITVLETSAFMKTMKRQQAVISDNTTARWQPFPTATPGELESLLVNNTATMKELVGHLTARPLAWPSLAVA
jgi:hypothetical protein